ncbi:MAG: hypothetical protein KDA86_03040 [Planctomycetaceae bacterium]|nr:hypothetical protein [Planctomycetaceae bacterium]
MQPPVPSLSLCGMAIAICGALAETPYARGEWVDQRTVDVFEIRAEFPLDDEAGQSLLGEFRRLRSDVESTLGIEATDDPIEVNLFANRRNYQKYLSVRVPEGASRVALFVKGSDRGRVYVYRHQGYEVDVRHECTHALLHNSFPYVPLWLDEGFAEYFEVPAPQRATGHSHLGSVHRAMFLRWDPSLSKLESRHDLNEMSGSDYRDSWAWVHYLLHGPIESRQVLSNYLYDIRIGNPAGMLSERLAQEVPGVRSQMTRHFQNLK